MDVISKPAKQATEIRQASLVAVAVELAAQHSPADITTGDLARAVGISQGAVFKHFASKEALWLAVLNWLTNALMTRLKTAADLASGAPALPALIALRAVFMAHVDFVVEHPGVPRVIFQELQSPDDSAMKTGVRSLLQRYRQLLLKLLQLTQSQQGLQPDIDLNAAATLFIGSVQGLVMQSLMSGDVGAMAQQAPGVFAIYQRGIQRQPTDNQGTP